MIFGWVNGKIIFIRNHVTTSGHDFDDEDSVKHHYKRISASALTLPAKWISYHRSHVTYEIVLAEDETDITIHTALIILAAAILPAIWLMQFRSRKRGTPERFPECGTPPAAITAA